MQIIQDPIIADVHAKIVGARCRIADKTKNALPDFRLADFRTLNKLHSLSVELTVLDLIKHIIERAFAGRFFFLFVEFIQDTKR